MPLIDSQINLILTWTANCVIFNSAANKVTTFATTDAKLYVPFATLSSKNNGKLLRQLKSGFKCTINWNKYQSKTTT